jgi:hypothetical protein
MQILLDDRFRNCANLTERPNDMRQRNWTPNICAHKVDSRKMLPKQGESSKAVPHVSHNNHTIAVDLVLFKQLFRAHNVFQRRSAFVFDKESWKHWEPPSSDKAISSMQRLSTSATEHDHTRRVRVLQGSVDSSVQQRHLTSENYKHRASTADKHYDQHPKRPFHVFCKELQRNDMERDVYPSNVVALPPGSGHIESFQFFIVGQQVLVCQVIVLKESAWIYVGKHDDQRLDNVTLVMKQSDTSLLGSNEQGRQIAVHLQKRFKLGACFVSYNGGPDQATGFRFFEDFFFVFLLVFFF